METRAADHTDVVELCAGINDFSRAQGAFSERQLPECLQYLHRAEMSGYDPDECAALRWQSYMLLGRFEEAWRESDSILARGSADPHRLWDNLPFAGNRVMIRCLHGYGDTIQFLRYVRLVRREAESVIVQTHPQLVELLRETPFVDQVTTWGTGPGRRSRDWDQQIEVMELPRAFRTTLATIPRQIPYLRVAPRHEERSRQLLGEKRNPRIGFLWEGGDWNPARNVPLSELRPLFNIKGADFFSFQRGPARHALAALGMPIADLSGDSPNIVHFAADLMNMDLLVTVDTMAAHLAGALGKPVFVLLPFEADWRWMLVPRETPWYPSMRLFRQQARGDWGHPIRQLLAALEVFLNSPAASCSYAQTHEAEAIRR
jgi:hypothetical protein